MIKFPSIEQFRNAVVNVRRRANYVGKNEAGEAIYDHGKPLPVLSYRGTVKLHGTNAGVVYHLITDECSFQSRERELDLIHDNAGFMLAMSARIEPLKEIARNAADVSGIGMGNVLQVAMFGEWCGQGIQRGVAINGLPRMYVVFAVNVIDNDGESHWIDIAKLRPFDFDPQARIYNILQFGTWSLDVDFSRPEIAQNELVRITEAVEAACPAGKHFGVDGVGEGVVWQCITPGWLGSDYWFKVKGEKHSASKVKTLAPVDVEAVAAIHEFVDKTVTESRLEQGLHVLVNEMMKPFDIKSMGDFLRWVYNDIIKEETDTIVASQLDPKKLGSPIANKARPWFMSRLNQEAGVA